MNRKYLVLDIDGTLTNSDKKITERTKKAIIDVFKRGHKVILASGRPTAGMLGHAKELEFEKYGGMLLSYNGGCIIDAKSGEIIFQKTLPKQVIPQIYKFACDHDCGLMTYLGDRAIAGTRLDEYMELEARINQIPIKQVSNFIEFVDFDVYKCLMTAPSEKAEVLEKELQKMFEHELSIYRSEPFFIEIMPKNIDKAKSLERMLKSVGLDEQSVICCGDGFNDLTMIQYAGIGVAMANAQEKVKEEADFITASNDQDGIVVVIDKFLNE